MKTGHLFGIIEKSPSCVGCVFCGISLPKANKCIKQHSNGAKHKENIELMTENGISLIDNKLYCKLCKRNLNAEESVLKHTEDDEHATWMMAFENLIDGEFITAEGYLSSEKDDLYCEVCKVDINCTLSSIEEHVNNFNHRAKVADSLKPINGIFPVENDLEVWCKICEMYVENTVQSILEHIDGQEHREWFEYIGEVIDDHDISIEDYLSIEHHNFAYCNRCNMDVVCTLDAINTHVLSDEHLNQI